MTSPVATNPYFFWTRVSGSDVADVKLKALKGQCRDDLKGCETRRKDKLKDRGNLLRRQMKEEKEARKGGRESQGMTTSITEAGMK